MTRVLALFAAIVVVPVAAFAQGSIAGIVTDSTRRALPGVTVIVPAPPSAVAEQTAVTDRSGRFVVAGLAASRVYTVGFLLPGFEPEWRSDVRVTTTGEPPIEIALRRGEIAETLSPPQPPLRPGRPLPQVPGRACLHDTGETAAEAQRRTEALAAMRLIARAVVDATRTSRPVRFPFWEELASSPAVEALKQGSGALAELARKMAWGSPEPLPGWRLTYVTTLVEVRFALADERDPCGFTYSSTDPQVIPHTARVLPLR